MRRSFVNTGWVLAAALAGAAFVTPLHAQQPGVTGGTVVASEPGRAAAVRKAEVSAQVVQIDKASRTLTLKGSKGDAVDLVAGDEVKNFDQIKLGDFVVVRYAEALMLELRKGGVPSGDVTVREEAGRARPGDRPAAAGARQVTAMAEVIAVDPQASIITLKGPRGNVATLSVQNPDQFKVVKQGDLIEVTYTEALAVSIEPAAGKK